MKKNNILMIIFFLIIVIITTLIITNKEKNNFDNKNVEIDKVKNDIGATGSSDIYNIQKDPYGDRLILTVKSDIKYKVAFAGMIENQKPDVNKIDDIFYNKHPKKNGVWIEENSRKKFLDKIQGSNLFNSEYFIDKEGYLKFSNREAMNENDVKLQKAIESNKQYILNISSICYIVDEITGEILDYSFEDMDQFQIYEYFDDENKMIIFITENKNNKIEDIEILNSLIKLIE